MVALALLLVLSASPAAARDAQTQPARLVFAVDERDFGRVRQGDPVEVEFPFSNRGDVDLSLGAPRVGCDCTATLSVQGDVAPGESGVVRVRFDTDKVHGAQRRTVTIYSNDPERRSAMLTLRGSVALDVVAEPAEVYVGSVTRGSEIEGAAVVRSAAATAVHSAASDGAVLHAWLVDGVEPATVALRIRDDAALGPFAQTVRVLTGSSRHPAIEIPVRGIVVAAPEPSRWPRQ